MARKEEVTRVIDGDTFETASRKNPVRLANVNAPEKGQPGYAQAKAELENSFKGKRSQSKRLRVISIDVQLQM